MVSQSVEGTGTPTTVYRQAALQNQNIQYIYIYTHTHTHTHTVGRVAQSVSDWLRAGRSGIESRWGRDFPPVQTGLVAHPASCKMGTGSFPGVKCGRGVLLTTHPLLVPRSWKSRAIPLPTLWATPGLKREHFAFINKYIYIYIYINKTSNARIT